jgi:hypothetical protein
MDWSKQVAIELLIKASINGTLYEEAILKRLATEWYLCEMSALALRACHHMHSTVELLTCHPSLMKPSVT